ncbi:MAG: hypothetical protein L7F77_01595 [Candidatus Magnetominusculus sp. LBB02]|nr:hypothetical protein [Candidatus Magnetominusculus sp. LBB02]
MIEETRDSFSLRYIIRSAICLALLCALAQVPPASALDVTIIESSAVKPYEDAIRGFEATCNCNIKKVIPIDHSGYNIQDEIRRSRPDMIVAVGEEALQAALTFKNIPTTYMMALNPSRIISGHGNAVGVSMEIPPHKQISSFLDVFPWIKRLGVVYNPANSGHFMRGAVEAALKQKVVLVEGIAHLPKDVPSVINSMKGKIDALWILPDTTVVTPENIEFLMLHSIAYNVPVLSFTDKHVALGAVMSLSIDPYEIGRQTGGIVAAGSTRLPGAANFDVSTARLSINHISAIKMNIAIKDNFTTRNGVAIINLDKNAERLP